MESISNRLQNLYDRKYVDEKWSPMVLKPWALSTTRYDDIARLLKGESGKLLEIGCGSGQLSLSLTDQFDHVIGIDLSAVRISAANRALAEHYPHYDSKTRFVKGNADEPFPFDDNSFDVVVACAVVEHVVDVFSLMDEIARVCKPNGCLLMTVPNICYIRHILDLIRGRVPLTGSPNRSIAYWRKHGWDGGHFHYFSKQTLDSLLQDVGFNAEKWTGDGKWAKLRRWYTNFGLSPKFSTVKAR